MEPGCPRRARQVESDRTARVVGAAEDVKGYRSLLLLHLVRTFPVPEKPNLSNSIFTLLSWINCLTAIRFLMMLREYKMWLRR